MRRGVDDSAIESLAEAAMPVIVHKGEANKSFISTDTRSLFTENKKYH